jgi:hypothetical protein
MDTFVLKKEHLKLLRHINWRSGSYGLPVPDCKEPDDDRSILNQDLIDILPIALSVILHTYKELPDELDSITCVLPKGSSHWVCGDPMHFGNLSPFDLFEDGGCMYRKLKHKRVEFPAGILEYNAVDADGSVRYIERDCVVTRYDLSKCSLCDWMGSS